MTLPDELRATTLKTQPLPRHGSSASSTAARPLSSIGSAHRVGISPPQEGGPRGGKPLNRHNSTSSYTSKDLKLSHSIYSIPSCCSAMELRQFDLDVPLAASRLGGSEPHLSHSHLDLLTKNSSYIISQTSSSIGDMSASYLTAQPSNHYFRSDGSLRGYGGASPLLKSGSFSRNRKSVQHATPPALSPASSTHQLFPSMESFPDLLRVASSLPSFSSFSHDVSGQGLMGSSSVSCVSPPPRREPKERGVRLARRPQPSFYPEEDDDVEEEVVVVVGHDEIHPPCSHGRAHHHLIPYQRIFQNPPPPPPPAHTADSELREEERAARYGKRDRTTWTKVDDAVVLALVEQANWSENRKNARRWGAIREAFVQETGLNRTNKQIRERYNNYLADNLNKDFEWTEARNEQLVALVATIGNRWADMVESFPGCSSNQIKNHWHVLENNHKRLIAKQRKREEMEKVSMKIVQSKRRKLEEGEDEEYDEFDHCSKKEYV